MVIKKGIASFPKLWDLKPLYLHFLLSSLTPRVQRCDFSPVRCAEACGLQGRGHGQLGTAPVCTREGRALEGKVCHSEDPNLCPC